MKENGLASQAVSTEQGLTHEQVQQRMEDGLFNFDTTVPTKSIKRIITENIATLFNFINFILAAAILMVGSYKNLLFLGVVVCNLAIGIFQEIRAKHAVDKLSILSAPKVHVIRDGRKQEIGIHDIVLDDIILYRQGNQVAADAVLLSGVCEVNESLITGESDLIHKEKGDLLLSGSFLSSGHCTAKVKHVGLDNYAAKISKDAKYIKKIKSEIMDSLNKIIQVVSVLILPIGCLLFWGQLQVDKNTFQTAVVQTAAALVGMIPEGLILLTSTVLAVSVVRLSHHKVLVQELYCIESLARVDVLCLDKTGTITQGTMELHDVVPIGGASQQWIDDALAGLSSALYEDSNPTFDAIKCIYGKQKVDWLPCKSIPFSSEKKWSGAEFKEQGTFLLGAPEFLFPGQELAFQRELDEYSQENRVLILAYSKFGFQVGALPKGLQATAFILIRDKIRPSAPQTLKFFAEQGVDVKIISGDNVLTVAGIARRAGLENAHSYIDATSLHSDTEIEAAAQRYAIFGRVTPIQKKKLVLALQKNGHTVAMTGDGVNDVLALKEADCSIAMASGSEAARNVSQLVLLNSDFEAMPRVVAEGRRSINNIQRSASLFLVKTIYATLLAIIFVFARTNYPFIPIQLTLISVLTIGVPSFVLALEPNRERIQGRFILNVIGKAIPGALTIVTQILCMMLVTSLLHFTKEEFSTLCVLVTGCIGLFNLFRISQPWNTIRKLLCASMCTGFAVGVIFFRNLFSLCVLSTPMVIVLVISFLLSVGLYHLFAFLFHQTVFQRKK